MESIIGKSRSLSCVLIKSLHVKFNRKESDSTCCSYAAITWMNSQAIFFY